MFSSRLTLSFAIFCLASFVLFSSNAQAQSTGKKNPAVLRAEKIAKKSKITLTPQHFYEKRLHVPRSVLKALNKSLRAPIKKVTYKPKHSRLRTTNPLTLTTTMGTGSVNQLDAYDPTDLMHTYQQGTPLTGMMDALSYFSNMPGQTSRHQSGGYVFIDNGPTPQGSYNSQVVWKTPYGQVIRLAGGSPSCGTNHNYPSDAGQSVPSADHSVSAVNACFNAPHGVTVLGDNSLLIADTFNNRIRYVEAATGKVWTITGAGLAGTVRGGENCTPARRGVCISKFFYGGAPIPLSSALIDHPVSVKPALDGSGFYVVSQGSNSVQFINTSTPQATMTTVAGDGVAGRTGDGGRATDARLDGPADIIPMVYGSFIVADGNNCIIRRVKPSDVNGVVIAQITTIAGNGYNCGSIYPNPPQTDPLPDGYPPMNIGMNPPAYMDIDANNNIYFPDQYNNRVWKLNYYLNSYPTATLLVGRYAGGWGLGDGPVPRAAVPYGTKTTGGLTWPSSVLITTKGLLISDSGANRLRMLSGSF